MYVTHTYSGFEPLWKNCLTPTGMLLHSDGIQEMEGPRCLDKGSPDFIPGFPLRLVKITQDITTKTQTGHILGDGVVVAMLRAALTVLYSIFLVVIR